MKTGIIAEFNPFHKGHAHLLHSVREESEVIIVVMSQDVVQRGEFSSFDKWWRTKTALENGADLVIGLPSIVSSQSAEYFATQSIRILNALGIDQLAFGAENPDREEINTISQILVEEPKEYSDLLKKNLKTGLNFPRARMLALESLLNKDLTSIKQPNNILALEYAKAIYKNNLDINLKPIKRIGSDYTNLEYETAFPSASGIRNALLKETIIDEKNLVYSFKDLEEHFKNAKEENLFQLIMYQLLSPNEKKLRHIAGMNQDMLNRILRISSQSVFTYESLINYLKTKNVTRASIRRLLTNMILGIYKEDVENFKTVQPYLRILGFNERGRKILSENSLTKISSVKRNIKDLTKEQKYFFDLDIRTANIRSLLSEEKEFNQDFTKQVIL